VRSCKVECRNEASGSAGGWLDSANVGSEWITGIQPATAV